VLALLGDEARRRSLGDAARQLAEDRYSWEAVAVQFEEAYDRALRGRENA
jgi:glycosyltransferase involved in cell wall biosynthesis